MKKILISFVLISGCSTANTSYMTFYVANDRKCTITEINVPKPISVPKNIFTNKDRQTQDEIIAQYIIDLKNNLSLTEKELKKIKDSLSSCESLIVIK